MQDPDFDPGSMIILAVDYDWIDRQYKYGHSHYAQSFLVERIESGGVFHLSEATIQAMSAQAHMAFSSLVQPRTASAAIRKDMDLPVHWM